MCKIVWKTSLVFKKRKGKNSSYSSTLKSGYRRIILSNIAWTMWDIFLKILNQNQSNQKGNNYPQVIPLSRKNHLWFAKPLPHMCTQKQVYVYIHADVCGFFWFGFCFLFSWQFKQTNCILMLWMFAMFCSMDSIKCCHLLGNVCRHVKVRQNKHRGRTFTSM